MASLAEKLAFLDDCEAGDVLVRDATGWQRTAEPACPPATPRYRAKIDQGLAVCERTVDGREEIPGAHVAGARSRQDRRGIDPHDTGDQPGAAPSLSDTTAAARGGVTTPMTGDTDDEADPRDVPRQPGVRGRVHPRD